MEEEAEKDRLEEYFHRMFYTFDGKNAIFKLKNNVEEVKDIID